MDTDGRIDQIAAQRPQPILRCLQPRRACSSGLFFALRPEMKVKTFLGTDAAEVDKLVNEWLAETNVAVRRTSTAFHRFGDRGKDALTGRTVARHGVGMAISVWYDEHPAKSRIRTGWFGKRQKENASTARGQSRQVRVVHDAES